MSASHFGMYLSEIGGWAFSPKVLVAVVVLILTVVIYVVLEEEYERRTKNICVRGVTAPSVNDREKQIQSSVKCKPLRRTLPEIYQLMPREMWDEVLRFCPTNSLLELSLVSKQWHVMCWGNVWSLDFKVPWRTTEKPPFTDKELEFGVGRTWKSLRRLYVRRSSITADGLMCIRIAERLVCLYLNSQPVNLALFQVIGNLTGLVKLALHGCPGVNDECLLQLDKLEKLERLSIVSAHEVTDAGVAHFHKYKRMKKLDLTGMSQLTDISANFLSSMPHLVDLNLSGCDCLTSVSLQFVSRAYDLKRMNLSFCGDIDDVTCGYIQDFTGLTNLEISSANVSSEGVMKLSRLVNLEVLEISGDRFDGTGLVAFAGASKLQRLYLSYCAAVTPHGIMALAHLPSLWMLSMCDVGATSEALVVGLAPLVNMTSIDLSSNSDLTTECLSAFIHMKQLSRLNLRKCTKLIIDQRFEALSHLKIYELDLSETIPTPAGLTALAKWKKLTSLALRGCQMPDADFEGLSQLVHLKSIDISETKAGLVALTAISKLQHVLTCTFKKCLNVDDKAVLALCTKKSKRGYIDIIQCPRVTDNGLREIWRGCPWTLSVKISSNNNITDAGLQHLTKIKQLSNVCLINLPLITVEGIEKMRSASVRELRVVNCEGISESDIQRLRQTYPIVLNSEW